MKTKPNWLELSVIAFCIILFVAIVDYCRKEHLSENMTEYKGGQGECRKEYLSEY